MTIIDQKRPGLMGQFAQEFASAEAAADAKEAALDMWGYGKPALAFSGAFSVYFNRHVDAPRVWIVAARDQAWEINVKAIELRGVTLVTRYEPQPPQPNHNGPPSAWFEGEGLVQVGDDGRAVITVSPPAVLSGFPPLHHHSPG